MLAAGTFQREDIGQPACFKDVADGRIGIRNVLSRHLRTERPGVPRSRTPYLPASTVAGK